MEPFLHLRSNTIVGDRAHSKGMVVARIIKGNIPVKNGVVHLIDKPLMIVARSLYEYLIVCYHTFTYTVDRNGFEHETSNVHNNFILIFFSENRKKAVSLETE